MKILFVNEYSQPISGAEYSQKELAQALGAQEFTPQWKLFGFGRAAPPLWFNNPIYYLYSAWQISRQDFDLIHVHGKYILPGAVIAGWLKRKPVVATVRDFKFLCPLALCFINRQQCSWRYFIDYEIKAYQRRYGYWPKTLLALAKLWQYQLKWWLNRCRQVIAVSPQLAQLYRQNGVKKVVSIYNLPPKPQPQAQGKIVLSVGKLSYGKGADKVIEAAQKLPGFRFVFAGALNPSLKPKFSSNCQYLGQLSHAAVLKLYPKAGVLVINSRWPEPLPRAGLEALSFGLPIVASNRGGNRELVKGNGYLVNPESARDIAAAIKKVFQHPEFASASRNLFKTRFNRQKITEKHLNLYRKVI
jgi:glycosyltransferase involved in cell wall biosynthesis